MEKRMERKFKVAEAVNLVKRHVSFLGKLFKELFDKERAKNSSNHIFFLKRNLDKLSKIEKLLPLLDTTLKEEDVDYQLLKSFKTLQEDFDKMKENLKEVIKSENRKVSDRQSKKSNTQKNIQILNEISKNLRFYDVNLVMSRSLIEDKDNKENDTDE